MYLSLSLKLAVLPLLTLAACGNPASPSPTEAPATLEGEAQSITVYSGRGENLVAPVIEMFERETGIEVNVKYGDTAELAALILEEGPNSPADLFFAQDAGALGAVAKEGLFVTLPSELTDLVPAQFAAANSTWIGISGRARVVVYNTEAVDPSDLPPSIDGFSDSRWQNQIGWAPTNGSFQAFVTAYRKLNGDAAAKQWLEAIKANGAKTFPNNTSIVQAAGAGEIQVGFVNHYYLHQIRGENPNIAAENYYFTTAEAGSLINVAGAGILKSSDAQQTAGRFIEFMLSEQGQRYFVKETFEYPLIAGVEAAAALPPISELRHPDIDLSDLDDLQGTLDILREVGLL